MIDLRKAVYYEYVDEATVDIFDNYKWGLRRLGINFSQELLETIVYCPQNLENTLIAFCSWVLWLRKKGEKIDNQILVETLINALRSEQGWIPFEFQRDLLNYHRDILENPQDTIWKKAGQQLGESLRNRVISHISEEGKIRFNRNIILNHEERQKIKALKDYIDELYL